MNWAANCRVLFNTKFLTVYSSMGAGLGRILKYMLPFQLQLNHCVKSLPVWASVRGGTAYMPNSTILIGIAFHIIMHSSFLFSVFTVGFICTSTLQHMHSIGIITGVVGRSLLVVIIILAWYTFIIWCLFFTPYMYRSLVGASLSEPHTSVTSLRTCVYMFACLLGPTTYRKF